MLTENPNTLSLKPKCVNKGYSILVSWRHQHETAFINIPSRSKGTFSRNVITFVHLFTLIYISQLSVQSTGLFLCKESTDADSNTIHCSWGITFRERYCYLWHMKVNNSKTRHSSRSKMYPATQPNGNRNLWINRVHSSTLGTFITLCFSHCSNIPLAHLFL